jgi:hypothetical protein
MAFDTFTCMLDSLLCYICPLMTKVAKHFFHWFVIILNSSLNVSHDGAELLVSIFWTLPIILCFSKPLHIKQWLLHCPQVKLTLLDLFD